MSKPQSAFMATVLLFSYGWAGTAQGYMCKRVRQGQIDREGVLQEGPSLSWFTREIPYAFYFAGTGQIPQQEEFAALRQSFLVWSNAELGGQRTDIRFVEASVLSNRITIGFNYIAPEENENLVLFHDDVWPYDDCRCSAQGPGCRCIGSENCVCDAAFAIALTTTTFNVITGEILDGDIEFNTANEQFSSNGDFTPINGRVPFDLMNAAVHEIGHMIGFAHSAPTDALPSNQVVETSMYESASPGETLKRDLHDDDKRGILFKYPFGQANGYCLIPDELCGFCAAPTSLQNTTLVTIGGTHDGLGGCAVGSVTPWFMGLPLSFMSCRKRRRL